MNKCIVLCASHRIVCSAGSEALCIGRLSAHIEVSNKFGTHHESIHLKMLKSFSFIIYISTDSNFGSCSMTQFQLFTYTSGEYSDGVNVIESLSLGVLDARHCSNEFVS